MSPILALNLIRDGHVQSFRVDHIPGAGWIAARWSDHEPRQQKHVMDWHHAERILKTFALEIAELHRQGWLRTDLVSAP